MPRSTTRSSIAGRGCPTCRRSRRPRSRRDRLCVPRRRRRGPASAAARHVRDARRLRQRDRHMVVGRTDADGATRSRARVARWNALRDRRRPEAGQQLHRDRRGPHAMNACRALLALVAATLALATATVQACRAPDERRLTACRAPNDGITKTTFHGSAPTVRPRPATAESLSPYAPTADPAPPSCEPFPTTLVYSPVDPAEPRGERAPERVGTFARRHERVDGGIGRARCVAIGRRRRRRRTPPRPPRGRTESRSRTSCCAQEPNDVVVS